MKGKKTHMVIRNSKFVCLVCGDEHPITMPITTKEMIKKIDAFIALHKGCPVSGANGHCAYFSADIHR